MFVPVSWIKMQILSHSPFTQWTLDSLVKILIPVWCVFVLHLWSEHRLFCGMTIVFSLLMSGNACMYFQGALKGELTKAETHLVDQFPSLEFP